MDATHSGANVNEDCTTTGAIAVAAGTHNIEFEVAAPPSTDLDDASVWVMWVPFDGT